MVFPASHRKADVKITSFKSGQGSVKEPEFNSLTQTDSCDFD